MQKGLLLVFLAMVFVVFAWLAFYSADSATEALPSPVSAASKSAARQPDNESVGAANGTSGLKVGNSTGSGDRANDDKTTDKTAGAARPGAGRTSLVVVAPVEKGITNDRLMAVGDGEARATVTVVPRDNGVLTEVLVGSGDIVTAGTVLATLDSDAEVIARDRAERAVLDGKNSVARFQALYKTRSSSMVQLEAAKTELANARLALRDADLKLRRRSIVAPISGTVGIVPVEQGNYVTTQTAIATIDDRSSIVVGFWIPERFATAVRIGQLVDATSYASPGKLFSGKVSAIGSRVESDSRTLEVEATIDNAEDRLRPGMSFSVTLRFPGDTFPAVYPSAVQWDSAGSFVWKIIDGKARRTAVRIVQRNPEAVLVEGELTEGDDLVIEGVLSLRDGAQVRVAGNDQPDRAGSRDQSGS